MAQEVFPRARAKGLAVLFDCLGPAVARREAAQAEAAVLRLFVAAVETLEEGVVFFTGRTAAAMDVPGCSLAGAAASSGRLAPRSTWPAVLERLQLHGVERMTEEAILEWKSATGVCPHTGGRLSFVHDPRGGSLFTLEWVLARATATLRDDDGTLDAGAARAWLVGDGAAVGILERRLQRLGWATRTLSSVSEATSALASMPADYSRPALVIIFSEAVASDRLRALQGALPSTARLVVAAPAGPSAASAPERGVEVRSSPLSPADLREFTRDVAGGNAASGQTQPAPLAFEQRRRALVVDDNTINQLVATGMLQMLGFEVKTAHDGQEAIDHCLHEAPHLVLMDLHMPGMDGLEATRRLRLLQREGVLPDFRILAATADTTSQENCVAAGMDGHLPKPLDLGGLERQLQQLLGI